MAVVQNPASRTDSHTWRQEGVKAEQSHPVPPLLPSVLGLVVLEAEAFEGNLSR